MTFLKLLYLFLFLLFIITIIIILTAKLFLVDPSLSVGVTRACDAQQQCLQRCLRSSAAVVGALRVWVGVMGLDCTVTLS